MDLTEKTAQANVVFRGRILTVYNDSVRLSDGSLSRREIVRHPGGAAVLLIRDKRALLVKQFRYAYGEELLEIPAGKTDPDEEPAVCAARELEEETGFIAGSLISLGTLYPSPGYTDERIRLYLCLEAREGSAHPDEGEFLRRQWIELSRLYEMIRNDELRDAKTVTALLRYRAEYEGEPCT